METKVIEGYRLSPQQRHLWLLQQADQSLAYRTQCVVLIEGSLDRTILNSALQDVINRHEILRTTFDFLPGMIFPIQVIGQSYVPSITAADLSDLDPGAQQAEIEALLQQVNRRPFDFQKLPLLHLSLVVLGPDEHLLLATLPALCADPVTIQNLMREISRSYAACLRGEELPDPSMQYTDLSEVLNELIESEETKAGRDYWREQDILPLLALQLPFEDESAAIVGFDPHYATAIIDSDAAAKIETLSGKYDTSVSVFFLACWQVLLRRLTGQTDIIVGTTYDGRTYEELKGALGLFAKYLPLRSCLEEELRFDQLLAQTDESVREAYEWQEYFTWEGIGAAENAAALPYFPFGFDFEESSTKYSVDDVSFSIYSAHSCFDKFKVKLSCVRHANPLIAQFHYDSNLFAADDIERLAGQFHKLLASVTDNPEARIDDLEIFSDIERRQLLVEFNDTENDYPRDRSLHQLFEEQAARLPDGLAVVFEGEQLTYGQLNARANQLARYLQTLGVGPDVCVGICVERSLEMVVGLLGILKAGGVYVPLDPTYPKQRQAFILVDIGAPVLLTQERLVASLPKEAQLVCLDSDWKDISQQCAANPVSKAQAENLAYVIYTSGSTGEPKGVMISHRGLANYLNWCVKAYQVADGRGSLVHSSIGFDLTVTSLFSPLLVGRTVVLLPESTGIDLLAAALREGSDFSLIKITPAHLEAMSQVLPAAEAADRARALVIGGEALSGESLSLWREYAPATRIINEYGPTETVVGCCTYEVPAGASLSGAVPIGRPIANTQIYLLDRHLRPVPVGVPGELYIGGDGLARGYLNRPDLTAESFVANPFSNKGGERLYKTGDLARHLPSGEVQYLARLDHQVKIRGFRVELGEIEAVLLGHCAVQQSVVLAREDTPGDKRLVAYIVAPEGAVPAPNELRSYSQQKLPEYMVPSAFVLLDEMPLTPNGKVDRKALPEPDQARREMEAAPVVPRTAVEEVIAAIWAELLQVETVGINDDFFKLGGHSLLATRLISRSNETFRLQLPIRTIFETPTIAGMVERMVREEQIPGSLEKMALLLQQLDALSEAEAEERLAEELLSAGRGQPDL